MPEEVLPYIQGKNENLWSAMQSLVMRDGRVYPLSNVLEKIRELKSAQKQRDVQIYHNNNAA